MKVIRNIWLSITVFALAIALLAGAWWHVCSAAVSFAMYAACGDETEESGGGI